MENIKIKKIVAPKNIIQRLDKLLVNELKKYSRSCIKKWIINSFVSVENKIINKPKKKIFGGEKIFIKLIQKKENIFYPQNIKLDIVYDDEDILIINKKNDIVVHPGIGNLKNTILNAIIYHYPNNIYLPRAGIIHRLDKNTTGLMIIAKNIDSYFILKNNLKNKKIIREYEAFVIGILKEDGNINKPIKKNFFKRIKMTVNNNGKASITHYKILENFCYHTHLRLKLETGRTHQIRTHMSYIRHNIIGDQLYGKNFFSKHFSNELFNVLKNFKRQALHAVMLEFYHPTNNNKIKFSSPIPNDMKILYKALKNDKIKNKNFYMI